MNQDNVDPRILQYNERLKNTLRDELLNYKERFPEEREPEQVLEFIGNQLNLFGRDSREGHITCSAWVVDPQRSAAILVRHRRLNKWVQPGGHIEPFESPLSGAVREAAEETGITDFVILDERLFDVSVHWFPEGKDGPAHFHYDLRYLLQAPVKADLYANNETDGAAWIPLEQLQNYSGEETVLKMAEKTWRWSPAGKHVRE